MTAIRTHIIIEFMRADKNTGERFNLVVLAKKSSAAAKCCDGQDARCRISNSETTARLISKHSCERSSTGIGLNQLIQDHVPGHDFSLTPKPDDGPVTVTWELIIRPEEREEFLALVKQLRLIFLRNGAFLFRFDENLEHPGTFRTEMLVSSWAEHLRQHARMTKAEIDLIERVWAMHAGDQEPVVRHYLPANRLWTSLGFARFRKQT